MRRGAPRLGVLGCTRPLVHGFGPTHFSSLGVNRSHMSSSCRFVLIHIALQSELGRYLLHGDDRYAVVSSRQRNTMTRAAWVTARFPIVFRFPFTPFSGRHRYSSRGPLSTFISNSRSFIYSSLLLVSFVLLWNYAFVSLVRSY